MLNSRLKELREAKLVCTTNDGYALTDMGVELSLLLEPFGAWAITWAMEVAPEEAERWSDCSAKGSRSRLLQGLLRNRAATIAARP